MGGILLPGLSYVNGCFPKNAKPTIIATITKTAGSKKVKERLTAGL